MANTFVKNYIHLVFHVKSRGLTMRKEDLPLVFDYIGGIVRNIDGFPIMVGGVENHIHILSSLPKNMTLADFVRTVKANSSKWLKTVDMYYSGFEWQTGYGAFSVSQSLIEQTERYIRNQERHHAKQSFNTEIRAILDAHEMEYDEQYLLGE